MAVLSDVNDFISRSRKLRNPEELKNLLSDTSRSLGFDYFALIHHVDLSSYDPDLTHMKEGRLVAVLDYPDAWVEAYITRNLGASDPVLIASNRTNVGFTWSEVPRLLRRKAASHQLEANRRAAGFEDGFTVPAHVPCEANGSCNFVMRQGHALPSSSLPAAQLVGAFAFQAARKIVADALGRREPPRPLTTRQLECVLLVGKGLSETEIASALGIANETVKRHLKEARNARGAGRTVQVLMRALFDGELALSDIMDDHYGSPIPSSSVYRAQG